ncbi:uncharacterized protein LOC124258052 [Haliotis rubra]|uniref:uncharacterized protein LOC124258052 n=1 Tax=Haliotis rubra TaxID=36100 RepID=UPI001EE58AF5|nr:uncharacterized protein LOC124258052 [Haliotis rubra]
MLSVFISLFRCFVLISTLGNGGTGMTFTSDGPSVLTKVYMAMVPELEDGSKDAGYIYLTTSAATATDAWVNAGSGKIYQNVISGETASVKLPKQVILIRGSVRKTNAFNVVTTKDLGIFFRNEWTFYQMRELSQLPFTYTVVSYSDATDPMLSVIGISVVFDATKLTITFREGINVTNVLGSVPKGQVKGQKLVFSKQNHRVNIKLEFDEDLTGTTIESSHAIAVIAGAISVDNTTRSVYIDHMATRNSGSVYIVFGLPDIDGSDTIRVVAKSPDTSVTLDNNPPITLTETGDFADVSFSRGSFHMLTASSEVIVAILLKNGGPRKTDMVIVHPVNSSTTSKYQFSIPSLSSDVNFKHYLVVTTDSSGQASMVLNGQALPSETVWFSISGTSHVGGYVPLVDTVQAQVIATTDGSYFNAYLMGYGDDATYGSALEGIDTPQEDTSDLQFTLDKTFCERTGQTGNYISNGTQMEITTVTSRKNKRFLSYKSIHRTTLHLQACQLTCFLYSDCIGVNYKNVSSPNEINCDIIMNGDGCSLKGSGWTRYYLK